MNQYKRALNYAGYGWPVLPLYGKTDGHCACKDGKIVNAPRNTRALETVCTMRLRPQVKSKNGGVSGPTPTSG